MRHWHEVLPQRHGLVERFNHGYSVRHAPPAFERTLEVGAGLGTHLEHEHLTAAQLRAYYALELRANMVRELQRRHPQIHVVQGDCQTRQDFDDGYFDRILAIHVFEHLPDLPSALAELLRLCDPERGSLSVVIPCDPGLAYGFCRRISAQRVFEKRYGQSYRWFHEREHINGPQEIMSELQRCFCLVQREYFPLRIPLVFCNLCIGLTLRPRPAHSATLGTRTSA